MGGGMAIWEELLFFEYDACIAYNSINTTWQEEEGRKQ
jgi:hypothetical protein